MGICHSDAAENLNQSSNHGNTAQTSHVIFADCNMIQLIYQYLTTHDIIRCRYVNHALNEATYNQLMHSSHSDVVQYAYTINSYKHAMLLAKCIRSYPHTINFITTINIYTDNANKLPITLFDVLSTHPSHASIRLNHLTVHTLLQQLGEQLLFQCTYYQQLYRSRLVC